MSIKFTDASALMLPPAAIPKFRHIELRLEEDGSDNRRFALVDGNDNSEKASLALDWSDNQPRWRIRIRRDNTDIIMEAEPAHTGPSYTYPLNYPVPPPHAVTVPIASFSFPAGTSSEFGFGHFLAGAYNSYWESIHVTTADDATTALPYWPPEPPAPTLVHDDMGAGNPQGIDFSADLSSSGYLANDTVTPELDADGTTYIGETRTNPGLENWDFDGLNDNQLVYGRVIATDVSGRSQTGSDGTATIVSQSPHLSCIGFEAPLDKGPITVRGKNRALPLKAQLFDASGFPVTDTDIAAPPKIQVLYDAGTGGTPVDVEDDVLSVGHGTEGVEFVYTNSEKWQFNLKTTNHSASGTYRIKMISGDNTEYVIDPMCEVSFIAR